MSQSFSVRIQAESSLQILHFFFTAKNDVFCSKYGYTIPNLMFKQFALTLVIQRVIDTGDLRCFKPTSTSTEQGQRVQHQQNGSLWLSLLLTHVPYVDSGLWIISFKDEMTWRNNSAISKGKI